MARSDVDISELNEVQRKEWRRARIIDMLSKESKEERIRRMFSKNEIGELSPELKYIIQGSYASFFFGALVGAFSSQVKLKDDFMRQNVATAFESPHLARRKFSDSMTLGSMKIAVKNGLKFSFSTTTYLLVSMTAATYNNKITVYEHMAAGALFGSIARINYGFKGILVAGGLGGFLGLFAGCSILGLMKLSDVTFDELRYWQHEYFKPEVKSTIFKLKDNSENSN